MPLFDLMGRMQPSDQRSFYSDPMVTGGNPPAPAPAPLQQPAPAPQQPGILSKIGTGIMDYLSDPINRKQLALGFNAMRLNPDANLARSLQSQIETAQAMNLLNAQGNKTADALDKAAENAKEPRKSQLQNAARLIRENPALAKEGAALLFKGDTQTEAFRTQHQKAIAAGLEAGTPEYESFMGAPERFGGLSEAQMGGVTKLRQDFDADPTVKSIKESQLALSRIYSSAEKPTAPSDLALIFNYMKMLDPGSVVRESEFKVAADARAWLDKSDENGVPIPSPIRSAIMKIETGNLLTEAQRQEFVDTATRIYQGQEGQYQDVRRQYIGYMEPYLGGQDANKYLSNYTFKHDLYLPPKDADPVAWNAMTLEQRRQWLNLGNK